MLPYFFPPLDEVLLIKPSLFITDSNEMEETRLCVLVGCFGRVCIIGCALLTIQMHLPQHECHQNVKGT